MSNGNAVAVPDADRLVKANLWPYVTFFKPFENVVDPLEHVVISVAVPPILGVVLSLGAVYESGRALNSARKKEFREGVENARQAACFTTLAVGEAVLTAALPVIVPVSLGSRVISTLIQRV